MQNKSYPFVKIAIMLVSGLIVFLIIDRPFIKTLNSVYNILDKKQESLLNNYEQGKNLKTIEADYEAMAVLLPSCEVIFSTIGGELKLIEKLEALAEKHNLAQKLDVSPTPIDYDENLAYETISLELKGDFSDIAYYLQDMQKIKLQLIINSANVMVQPESGVVNAKLIGNSYWLKNNHPCK